MLPFSGGKDRIGEKKSTGGKGQGEEGGDNRRPGLGRKAEARAGEGNVKRKSDDGQDGIEAKGGRASGERQKENGQDMTTDRPGLRRKEKEQPGRSRERRGVLLRAGKRAPDSRAESVLRGEARERNKERRKNGRPLRSREKRQREKRVKIKSRGFGKQAVCRG